MQEPKTPAKENTTITILVVLILLGTVCRLVTPLQCNPVDMLFSDPQRHWVEAADAFRNDPLSAMSPIVYQVWLLLIQKITVGDRLAFGVYSGILSAITPWIWYLFFREAVENKILALSGWAILVWLPSWIGIYSYVMEETLLLPLLGLSLWSTWRTIRLQTVGSFVWSSVSWILTILTKSSMLPAAILCIVCMLLGGRDKRRRLCLLALLLVCFLVPLSYRNHKLIGSVSPFGYAPFNTIYMLSGAKKVQITLNNKKEIGGSNWYWFQSPSTGMEPLSPLSDWKTSRQGDAKMSVDLNHADEGWANALKQNWPAPKVLLRMYFEQFIYWMFTPSWPDCNLDHFWEMLQVSTRWVWAPLFCLAALGNARYFYRIRRLPLLPALNVVLWLSMLLLPGGVMEGRYRKPAEGLLVGNILWLLFDRERQNKLLQKGEMQSE